MTEQTSKHPRPLKDLIPDEALEHLKAAHAEMHKSMETLLPPGFIEHRRAARKEVLKAARSVLDAALKKLESATDS